MAFLAAAFYNAMFLILFVLYVVMLFAIKAAWTRRNPFSGVSKDIGPDDLYLEPWENEESLEWRKERLRQRRQGRL